MKDLKFKILSVCLSVVSVFVFTEILLRINGLGYDNAGFENSSVFHHEHKKDYVFVNDNPASSLPLFEIYYDDDGCVSSSDYEEKDLPLIVLMGDSYLEGAQVSFDSSLTHGLQKEFQSTYRIKNYAVGSYSPIIHNLLWKNKIKYLKPEKVILQLYVNDVAEDSLYLTKAKYNSSGELIAIDGGEQSFIRSIARSFYVFRWLRKYYMQWRFNLIEDKSKFKIGDRFAEADSYFKNTETEIQLRQLSESIIQEGVELILVVIPSRYRHMTDDSYKPKFYKEIKDWSYERCRFLDLQIRFDQEKPRSLFFEDDIHFNSKGHKVVLEEFINAIR